MAHRKGVNGPSEVQGGDITPMGTTTEESDCVPKTALLVFEGGRSSGFDEFDLLQRPLKREQFFSHPFNAVDDLSER